MRRQGLKKALSGSSSRFSFGEAYKYLMSSPIVIKSMHYRFGDDADRLIDRVKKGEAPEFDGIYIPDFLYELLINDAQQFGTYTARGDFGNYPIQIFGLGDVYYYFAPEFGMTGYFLSKEDAAISIQIDWADNLVSYETSHEEDAVEAEIKSLMSSTRVAAEIKPDLSPEIFAKEIKRVLKITDGWGGFSETMTLSSGEIVTYQFSLATGLGWEAAASSYKAKFLSIPVWVNELHPAKRISLCDLALQVGQALPQMKPS